MAGPFARRLLAELVKAAMDRAGGAPKAGTVTLRLLWHQAVELLDTLEGRP